LAHSRELHRAGEHDAARLISQAKGIVLAQSGIRLDYFEIVDPGNLGPVRSLANGALVAVAAFVGTTRLLDNILLPALSV